MSEKNKIIHLQNNYEDLVGQLDYVDHFGCPTKHHNNSCQVVICVSLKLNEFSIAVEFAGYIYVEEIQVTT